MNIFNANFWISLYKLTGSEHLVFIGGTAIHIIYDSHRFSEDLDFDNFNLNYSDFKRLLETVCSELRMKGFAIEPRFFSRKKVFHCDLKFPDVLRQYNLPAHHQEKILICVDAEKKRRFYKPEVRTLNKFGIFRSLAVAPVSVLLAQKLLTIFSRKRERGRDFYDVSFLSGLAQPDWNYLKRTIGLSTEEFKSQLLKRCENFNLKALAEDVAPFLFNLEQKRRILNFNQTIQALLKKT